MDPLFEKGWVSFNERQWDITAETIEIKPDKGSAWLLRTIFYVDKKGRLVMPDRNSHLPVLFECNSTKPTTIASNKTEAISKLAEKVVEKKPKSNLIFSSIIDDVRPFQWAGFNATPRYTYILMLKDWREKADKRLLRHARRAKEQGFYCELTDDIKIIQECLRFSEERKGFSHRVSNENLEFLLGQLGSERLLASVCYSKEGVPVGARLTVCTPGDSAYAWSAGINIDALRAGCNPLLFEFVVDELLKRNCSSLDLVGANIPEVATAKSAFGGQLITYYSVERMTLRNLVKQSYIWLRRSERALI